MKKIIAFFILLSFFFGCRSVTETIEPQNIPSGSFQIILKNTGEVLLDDTNLELYEVISNTHIMHLNASGLEKIRSYIKWDTRWTPPTPNPEALYKKDFLIKFDGKELYSGQFFSLLSETIYNGYTIMDVFTITSQNYLTINTGYPATSYFSGDDARNNPDLFKYLTALGKFKQTK
jgi:hypothetical protein